MDDSLSALLCDFGLAIFSNATGGHQSKEGGSIRFTAPELFMPNSVRSAAADVYAFAHLIYQVSGRVFEAF